MKTSTLSLLFLFLLACPLSAQRSALVWHGNAAHLEVDGRPFLILGGELGNSSASCPDDIERIFPKLQRMGLNTVLAPVYWDLTEPAEGQFDFSLTDKMLQEARRNQLKIIFLWFGAWKNSMSCYAPLWLKADSRKYPRARTASGKPLEIASAFSENVFQADHRAFTAWLEHVAQADNEQGTVIMIQIENEIGMLEAARDHSPEAEKAFRQPVPQTLMRYLQSHRETLHPHLKTKWDQQGQRREGTWQEVFGADLYTDEIFMAWHYATYVERLAASARNIYNVPLYVNTALNSRNRKPGEYPSAGPLDHLIDVWKCAAPHIDLLAPDIYDDGFAGWAARYDRSGNPLFIPEMRLGENNGARALYVLGRHNAIGVSPFSIEDGRDDPSAPLVQSYRTLAQLTPLIERYKATGHMSGLLLDKQNPECQLTFDDLTLTCSHYFTLPWDARATDGRPWPEAGAIVIRLNRDEYIVAGTGIVVEFATTEEKSVATHRAARGEDGFLLNGDEETPDSAATTAASLPFKATRCGLGSVDEVDIAPDGTFTFLRRLNGDQSHQGRHARISVDDCRILHIQLYRYR